MTEGKLLYSSAMGRWAIIDSRGKQELTSGRSIDVWLGGQWISGHVERNRFFIAHRGGVCALCTSMRVRILRV